MKKPLLKNISAAMRDKDGKLSFAAIAFLAVTGGMSAVSSLHAAAFQLFWLLPVWTVSYFMK